VGLPDGKLREAIHIGCKVMECFAALSATCNDGSRSTRPSRGKKCCGVVPAPVAGTHAFKRRPHIG